MNTAQALAAVFDFVREANTAMDKGEFRHGDVAAAVEFLASFDKVFAVLEDNDGEKLKAIGMSPLAAAGTALGARELGTRERRAVAMPAAQNMHGLKAAVTRVRVKKNHSSSAEESRNRPMTTMAISPSLVGRSSSIPQMPT